MNGRNRPETGVVVMVLGTAQDGGIPHIGCRCVNCARAEKDPRFVRRIASLAILDFEEEKVFLVDATPDIRSQTVAVMDRIRFAPFGKTFVPHGVLLTHAHIGHYTGLMFYGYEGQAARNIPVYCSERMAAFLKENGPWSQLVRQENIRVHPIQPAQTISLTRQVVVQGFSVPHRDEFTDTLGFCIRGRKKALLYIPDIQSWESWGRSLQEELGKVQLALLDGTFYSPEDLPSRNLKAIGHPFIQDTMALLKSQPPQGRPLVYFTHLNHTHPALDPDGRARKAIEEMGFSLGEDGMEFRI